MNTDRPAGGSGGGAQDKGAGAQRVDMLPFPPEESVGRRPSGAGSSGGEGRSRFPLKAAGLAAGVLLVLTFVYLRCAARDPGPDSSQVRVSGTAERLVMQVGPGVLEEGPEPTGLKPLERPVGEGAGVAAERLRRLEERMDVLESKLDLLNGGLDLLRREVAAGRALAGAVSEGPRPPQATPERAVSPAPPAPAAQATRPADEEKARYHVVRRGDTLFGIARTYNVSVRQIKEANGLADGEVIRPGQRLRVPRPQ